MVNNAENVKTAKKVLNEYQKIKGNNFENIIDEIKQQVYITQYQLNTQYRFLGETALPYIHWWIPEDIYTKYSQSNELEHVTSDIITIMDKLTYNYLSSWFHDLKFQFMSSKTISSQELGKDGSTGYLYMVEFKYIHEE